MSILLLKAILSIVMVILSIVAMFTMFEVFGKGEKKYNIEKIKKIHRANGIIYFLIFLFITYFCLKFIITSKAELSPRGTFHSIFALTIIILFGLKVSFIKIYRQFYGKVQTIGILIALLTFGMAGVSGGYYLLVTEFGSDDTFDEIMEYKEKSNLTTVEKKDKDINIVIKVDPKSISRGKNLFDAKCSLCHDPYSTNTIVGPGLKGILKNPKLPVSNKLANSENITMQLKQPFDHMPPFAYLSEKEVANIIAFLNTL